MNDLCPNCGQATNSSFSRLVKDACGHMKCRMCLLYEEQGCESCRKESGANGYNKKSSQVSDSSTSLEEKCSISDVIVPLELTMKNDLSFATETTKIIQQHCFDDEKSSDKLTTLTELKSRTPDELELSGSKDFTSTCERNNGVSCEESEEIKLTKTNGKKYNNKNHIMIVSVEPEMYQCLVCQKTFKKKKCINYHNACATGVKPFQCTICNKSFINRSHFEYHERTHTGYKPFKCNLCDKAFPQKNKLNRHMSSHSSEKNFACLKCDKKYSKKADLQSHLYVHSSTSNNLYSCSSCAKSFGNLTHLKRHSRAHSNERPHVCEHCSKSFKDKSLLVRHYKTHGKDRPFICAHCSRGFLTKSELRRHLTVHSDEKPFSCTFCHTVFRRKDNLNRHIRHHHSEDERSNVIHMKGQAKSAEKSNLGASDKPKRKSDRAKKKKQLKKSQNKAMKITYANSLKQINSRLDPMGNITSVIRTTGEVSNAVPVINGPAINRRYAESTDVPKKTLTYMEPIPAAEAVVINKRIEAKLYPQSNISQNYFFHDFSDPTDNPYLSSSSLLRSSLSFSNRTSKPINKQNANCDAFNSNDTSIDGSSISVPDRHKQLSYINEPDNVICYEQNLHNNYVSTITKHPIQNKF